MATSTLRPELWGRFVGGVYAGKKILQSEYRHETMSVRLRLEDGSVVDVPDDSYHRYRAEKLRQEQRLAEMQSKASSMQNAISLAGIYGFGTLFPYAGSKTKKFPRTREQRIARMNRYVEWKRQKIREKWVNRIVAGIVAYFGAIVLIVGMSYANRLLFHAVLS